MLRKQTLFYTNAVNILMSIYRPKEYTYRDDFLGELIILRDSEHLISVEIKSDKKVAKLSSLSGKTFKNLRDKKKYKDAILNIKEIINLAKTIKKNDIVDEYSKVLINLQEDLKFEELKESVKILNDEGLAFLRRGEIKSSLEKFKSIQTSLNQYKK